MKNALVSFFLLLTLSCCKKDSPEPGLPPITTTGANTFGCRINGKIWLPSPRPKGNLPKIEGGIVERYKPGGGVDVGWYDLLIFADKDDLTGFQLFLRRINGTGQFQLFNTISEWPSCVDCTNSYAYYYQGRTIYKSLTIIESSIVLARYDTLNKIFSGTFSFIAKNKSGEDTLKITDGRFDIDQTKIN
jgi:hypothetical protein